jgi:hypothetical protein
VYAARVVTRRLIAALALSSGGCDFAFRLDHVGPAGDVTDAQASVDATPTPFAFVQSSYGTHSDGAPFDLDYPGAQAAGNLNVVIIGWASAPAITVSDDNGNTYQIAQGAMTQGTVGQAIYYAENIAAGPNRVHVAFSGAQAQYPDVRILEYAGPVHDAAYVGGLTTFGNGTEMLTGPLPIAVPHALLVGSFTVAGLSESPGPDYTERVRTPYGNIVEDREILEAGSYTASAIQGPSAAYVGQLAAFSLQ